MTRELYREQLRRLNNELVQMGDLCEESMSMTMKALREKDDRIAENVHQVEQAIDEKQRDIENMCMMLLLRQQPVAGDLRAISSALRMITDMERIGDQTADIADISRHLSRTQMEIHPQIFRMAKYASQMVSDAVNAFVHKDRRLAEKVIAMDDLVDELFDQIKAELTEEIRRNSEKDGHELDLMMITKYLERIGDHAVNLGEWVLYSLDGHLKSGKE